jgi:hypothetical protein
MLAWVFVLVLIPGFASEMPMGNNSAGMDAFYCYFNKEISIIT